MDDLAADVDALVIERRDRDRERPIPAVLHVLGTPPVARLGPHPHVARVTGRHVVDLEPAVIATRPHRAIVDGVGKGEATLAAADVTPLRLAETTRRAAARHTIRR